MKLTTTLFYAPLCLAAAVMLEAQESAMPTVKPGPEHALLKKDVGTWDATVEMMAPGEAPSTSKGVETNRMIGDLWLVSDFKSSFMGQAFEGHGTAGWDPAKKKYVGTWIDTMSTSVGTSEATYDPATKKATGFLEGPDMTGKVVKSRSVVEYKDANTRVMQMFTTGPDGKEVPTMKISYTKK